MESSAFEILAVNVPVPFVDSEGTSLKPFSVVLNDLRKSGADDPARLTERGPTMVNRIKPTTSDTVLKVLIRFLPPWVCSLCSGRSKTEALVRLVSAEKFAEKSARLSRFFPPGTSF